MAFDFKVRSDNLEVSLTAAPAGPSSQSLSRVLPCRTTGVVAEDELGGVVVEAFQELLEAVLELRADGPRVLKLDVGDEVGVVATQLVLLTPEDADLRFESDPLDGPVLEPEDLAQVGVEQTLVVIGDEVDGVDVVAEAAAEVGVAQVPVERRGVEGRAEFSDRELPDPPRPGADPQGRITRYSARSLRCCCSTANGQLA